MGLAAAIISGSLLASRLLGLVRLEVFAALFGTSPELAAYNTAFRIPDALFTLVAGGALVSAFVPVFSGLLEQEKEDRAWQLASSMLNAFFLLLIIVSALAFLFANQLTDLLVLGGRFSPGLRDETANLTRVMLVQPILLGLGGLFTAIQNSYRRFLLAAIAPVLYNVCIILGALLFSPGHGVYAAAWSVVIGALVMFELQVWGIRFESVRYRPLIGWRLAEVKEVARLAGPRLIGLSTAQIVLVITANLASALTSAGLNSVYYAWALIMFPVGAIGTSLGTAMLPTLSRHSAANRIEDVSNGIAEGLRTVIFFTLPATIGLMFVAQPLVVVLFAHGQWSAASTNATVLALVFYSLAIPPLTLIEVIARGFYAIRDTRTPVTYAVVGALLDTVLMLVLVHFFTRSTGQAGLAIATAIGVWTQVLLLGRAMHKRLPGAVNGMFWKSLGQIVLATLLMAIAIASLNRVLGWNAFGNEASMPALRLLVMVAAGASVYMYAAYIFRMPEVTRLLELRTRFLRK